MVFMEFFGAPLMRLLNCCGVECETEMRRVSSECSSWPSASGAALPSKAFLFIVGTMNRLFRIRFLFLMAAVFSISVQAEDQEAAKKDCDFRRVIRDDCSHGQCHLRRF